MGRKGGTVAVIGMWHLGTVAAACLADMGHTVTGMDMDSRTIEDLSHGKPPLFEPGLDELIRKGMKRKGLSFTTDFRSGLEGADYIVVAFDTKVNEDDTPDLSQMMEGMHRAIPHLKDGCMLVISSQVPVGTCEQIRKEVLRKRKNLDFGIACVPENLKLGEAIRRFENPDVLVVGAGSDSDSRKARALFGFVEDGRIRLMGLRTAEMVKHAINSFLANQISFANEMGNLSDSLGVDWMDVADAMRMDRRIGRDALLRPGLAFGGGTLARDVGVLRRLGSREGVRTALLDAVSDVNCRQNLVVVGKLKERLGKLAGLNVCVLGLTYKPGTSTVRRSASLQIIRELVKEGAKVRAYDPKAELSEKDAGIRMARFGDAASAADSSDAVLLLTAWPEFAGLDYAALKRNMRQGVLIDAVNMLDPKRMEGLGFVYLGIGRGKK